MDNKSILLIVLLVFLILICFIYVSKLRKFSDKKYTSQNLIDMFNSLEVAEKRCEE